MTLFYTFAFVAVLVSYSECVPDIFKFSSQPISQSLSTGGSVTLTCIATGRQSITYSWYKLAEDFKTPPEVGDLFAGQTGTSVVISASDVDNKDDRRMFQCKATSSFNEVLLSNVATVQYLIPDNIIFTGAAYNDVPITAEKLENDGLVFRFPCNENEADIESKLSNGKYYNVYWYKGSETDRVETKYANMWTYYKSSASTSEIKVDVGKVYTVGNLNRYDLIIYNIKTTDAGTYYCKAESEGDSVILGSTILSVNDGVAHTLDMSAETAVSGYTVLAVNNGKLKSQVNVGDKVLLMCGAACRTSGGSNVVQYEWTSQDDSTFTTANSREVTVTANKIGTVNYSCKVTNCGSPSASSVILSISAAVVSSPTFNFSSFSPEYMWYYTSDGTSSNDTFQISCQGAGSTTFINSVYKDGTEVAPGSYDFTSAPASVMSGIYQCAFETNPVKISWEQKTTNVLIATDAIATISSTITSIQDGTTAIFTCSITGYPIDSVTVDAPNSLKLNCLVAAQTGDATCAQTQSGAVVVEVKNFSSNYNGTYKCTVKTKWYKTDGTVMGNTAEDKVILHHVKASTTVLTFDKPSVEKGETVTLTCTVDGSPEPSTPTVTKTASDGTTSDVVVTCTGTIPKVCRKEFTSVFFSDSGNYRCDGSNVINGETKSSTDNKNLTVEGDADVTLIQDPSDNELDLGSSVTFTCKVEGFPLPTKLKFKSLENVYKEYDNISSDSDITTGTYYISYVKDINGLTLRDTSDYTCEGENYRNGAVKTDSDVRNLIVVSAVSITMNIDKTYPSKGNPVKITCVATGGRKPHLVELKHADKVIKSNSDTGFCVDRGDFTLECTETILNIGYSNDGNYSCFSKNVVKNGVEETAEKIESVSVSKIVSVSSTQSSEVNFGSTFTLSCSVEGGLAPHKVVLTKPKIGGILTWTRAGGVSDTLTCSGENVVDCTYEISPNSYSDSGKFTCTGYNYLPDNLSTVNTDDVNMVVDLISEVVVTLTATKTEVEFGKAFDIKCVAKGGRIPFYIELNHTAIGSSTPTQIVLYDKDKSPARVVVDTAAQTLTFIYTVAAAGYGDIGEYNCSAKNLASQGSEISKEKSVSIAVVKPVQSTISAPSVLSKGASLSINCTAEGYRPPTMIRLSKDGQNVIVWSDPMNNCSELSFYKFRCSLEISNATSYKDVGSYMCTSKNNATDDMEVFGNSSQKFEISQNVVVVMEPSDATELHWDTSSLTLTCAVKGGLPPHRITLDVPGNKQHTWARDSSDNDLQCVGEHEVTCSFPVPSTQYNSSGTYKCSGYNYLPNSDKEIEATDTVDITVTRAVFVSLTSQNSTDEVNYGDNLAITCVAEGSRTPFYLLLTYSDTAIVEYNEGSTNPSTESVAKDDYTLQYVHEVMNVDFSQNGRIACEGRNLAAGNLQNNDTREKTITIVKDVEITPTADITANFNEDISIPISFNGGRAPHSLEVIDPNGVSIASWTRGSSGSVCSGTNVMTCTVQQSSVNFSHDGTYTITAKNKVAGNVERTATDGFNVTVFKDVAAVITPATNMEMTYKEVQTISCSVEGGLPPHQVDLTLPQLGTKSWTRDGDNPSLTCSGKHTVTCQFSFTAEYSSDGEYVCKGYNVVRSTTKENEMKVGLVTVRATEVTITESSTNVLTDGMLQINCTVLGKPLVDVDLVSWKLSDSNINLTLNYSISEKSDFMLISTLLLDNPSVEHSGIYSCLAGSTTGHSNEITIAEKEFLNKPVITLTPWDSVKKGAVVTVTCTVEGFPEKEVSVTVQHYDTSKDDLKILSPQSTTLKEKTFLFENTATCNDGFYVCNVKTMRSNGDVVETALAIAESPILEGCENMVPVIAGGVGGSIVFIVIIVLIVLFLVRRCRNAEKSKRSHNANIGLQYPNAAFNPDCTDTQIGGDKAGYSHLDRPSQPSADERYSSISNLKPSTIPAASGYSNLDTMTNNQLARTNSDAAYAALSRPPAGKENGKRGVVRMYKPISAKLPTTAPPPKPKVPNKPAKTTTNHTADDKAEPMYSSVDPSTKKAVSEYADVVIQPPEVPKYSSIDQVEDDPVYAQVDPSLKNKGAFKDSETAEDFAPDVPVYGTMGEHTEEDPYMAVEFKPKWQRQPPPVQSKSSGPEGLYTTITDLRPLPDLI